MQGIDFSQLEELDKDISNLIKQFPEMRMKLHEEFADVLKSKVDSEIGNSVNDESGKIKGFQGKYVGSKGGYAAVRAIDTSSGKESPGAITNYLEGGHKIRKPSGKNKYYKRKVNKIYVDGNHFYESSFKNIEFVIFNIAEQFAEDLVNGF